MRLTFELVNLVEQIALPMWVGFTQLGEGLDGTKRLSKRKLLRPEFCWAGISAFTVFGLELKHLLVLGLEPTSFTLEIHHRFS